MTRRISVRARGLLAVTAALQLAALASGRADLAIVTVPIAVFLAAGLAVGAPPRLHGQLELERERLLEHDTCRATLTLGNHDGGGVFAEIEVAHSDRLTVSPGGRLLVWLGPGAERTIMLQLRATSWGALELGPVRVRARGRLALVDWHGRIDARASLRVFPAEQRLHELIAPARTQPFLGSHVARAHGDGIEFAEIRPFVPGDRARQINWRVTARRGMPYVTDRHPEHASDVVLLLDTFAEARGESTGTLDEAVRATAALARAFLAERDRVALVDLGGTLQWLEPAAGPRQLYRIIDALLGSEIVFSYVGRSVESIPRKALPPRALVVAVTPLLDQRSMTVLVDLRRRGYDLAVVEVSPLELVGGQRSAVASQLWRLQREAASAKLRAMGVAASTWSGEVSLGSAIEEVNRFRRSVPRAERV